MIKLPLPPTETKRLHNYHEQSKELFSFINAYYPSNDRLHIILSFIDEEEQGKWK